MHLHDQFQQDMLTDSDRYRIKTKTKPIAFLQMLARHGGVETARRLIASPKAHLGFTRAWEYRALHLTAEYLVAFGRNGAYRQLFTDEEVASAERRLRDHGLDGPHEEGL